MRKQLGLDPVRLLDATTVDWVGVTNVDGEANSIPTALTLWTGTLAQYDAIPVKDPTTVYICTAS